MYKAIREFDIQFHSTLNPTQEGREAYRTGYSLSHCPYQKDSVSEKAWFQGWAEEDGRFREKWRRRKSIVPIR